MEATMGNRTRDAGGRLYAGGAALILTLACAGTLTLFSAEIAINGDLVERAAVPLRMLALVGLATLLLAWSGDRWSTVGLTRPASVRRAAGLIILGYLGVALVAAACHMLLPVLGIAPKLSIIFGALRGNTAEYLYWLLPVAWGSAAFGEELVFRGCLQSRLERLFGSGKGAAFLAALVQAMIFGAMHGYQGAGGAMLAGGTGLVLGLVYVVGGRNLWACIVLHGLIDTISLTALYLDAMP